MKVFIRKWMIVSIIGAFFFAGTSGLYAAASRALPKGMTPEKLERSVVRMLDYVDTRLLNGKSAKKIEDSENYEAIARLYRCREDRDLIAAWINQGQFEDAYWALKDLNKILKGAMAMSRAQERAAKKAKDKIDAARAISDAYFVRAKQRGIHKGNGGKEALELFISAQERRLNAQDLHADKDYQAATAAFERSIKLLKKAIAFSRKQGGNKRVSETQTELNGQSAITSNL